MDKAEQKRFAETFYSRQILLNELGVAGQQKLAASRVAVVGVGGLGSVSSLYLALAGVGYLRLIDQDTVEAQNLHRQILYTPNDLHCPKAEAAAKHLAKQNPLIQVEARAENVNASNVEGLLEGVDCVVDGLDNMATRYLVNRACVKLGVPYVFGAAVGLEGNLSVFAPPDTGCLECLLPNLSDNDLPNCSSRGVIGATPGIIGSMLAMETLKLLAGIGTTLKGKLLVCDFSDMDFTAIDISKNKHCPTCHNTLSPAVGGERLVWLCGKDTANINPPTPLKLSLDEVYPKISDLFTVRLKSQLALMFSYQGCDVSLFNGGRMLLKGVTDEKTALQVYREILQKLGYS
ncbi:MAG: HesA/MoeB/ThiF family protein [Candidatus Bathyarchaeota archaeon]|nr:HesA/MoeB/ThiF family protein [Candidatus Bathyarchaeota archaeon]